MAWTIEEAEDGILCELHEAPAASADVVLTDHTGESIAACRECLELVTASTVIH